MLKEYPEYKSTPATWIEKIPSTWTSKKIRELYRERRVKVSDKDFEPLSVCKAGIVPQLEDAVKTDNGDNRRLVKKGDFVINSRSDRKGSSGVSEYDGSVSLICLTLCPITADNKKFMHYLLRSVPFAEEYYRNGRGLVSDLWTTKYSEMKNIFLPMPPLEEQNQIVKYLDCKTKQIEEYVQAKEKEIEALLELKKSNIIQAVTKGINNSKLDETKLYWYPKKPVNWTLKRAKFIFKKENRIVKPEYETVTCFRDGEVTLRKNRRITGFTESLQENGYQGVMPGDLVIHVMDAFAGAVGVSDSEGKSTPVYNVCNPTIEGINNYFYAYFIRFMAWSGYIVSLSKGIRERSTEFRFDIFGNQFLPIPPIEEQNAIVEYIDKTTATIQKKINTIQKEIELLKELRTKLISDVVTGKVDVREVV